MAEWFFRKKSKGEVERDPGRGMHLTANGLAEIANQWKDDVE